MTADGHTDHPNVAVEAAPGFFEFRQHWRALAGCTLAASVGAIGLNAYSGGAFVSELVRTAGYTREQLSSATLLLSAVVACVAPFMGQALDRWGAVRVITLALAGEVLGFLLLAVSPAGFGWFAAATAMLGLLGGGTTPPSYSRVVAARFDRRRGLALGVMISGLGMVAIAAPFLMTRVIAAVGWRGGYATLAAAVAVVGTVGVLLIRSDGPGPAAVARRDGSAPPQGGWSALRRPLYWWVLLSFAAAALFGGGFLLHLISILRERGFSPGQAAAVQSLVGVAIVAGRCSSGWAMDRVFAPYVAALAFAVSAAGTALLMSTSGPLLCVAALGVGLTIGAELDILGFTLSRYFGVPSFGRLYSLAYSLMILAGGASPLLIARLARGGDYAPAVRLCAAGLAVTAVAVALLPRFPPRTEPEPVA